MNTIGNVLSGILIGLYVARIPDANSMPDFAFDVFVISSQIIIVMLGILRRSE